MHFALSGLRSLSLLVRFDPGLPLATGPSVDVVSADQTSMNCKPTVTTVRVR